MNAEFFKSFEEMKARLIEFANNIKQGDQFVFVDFREEKGIVAGYVFRHLFGMKSYDIVNGYLVDSKNRDSIAMQLKDIGGENDE